MKHHIVAAWVLFVVFTAIPVVRDWPVIVLRAVASEVDTESAEESSGDGILAAPALDGVLPGDVILCYGLQNDPARTATCTDSISSSYSAQTYFEGTGPGPQISRSCAVAATSGNPVVTITLNAADFHGIIVYALRGLTGCTPADSDAEAGTTSQSAQTPALTTVKAGISTAVMYIQVTRVITSGGGYTTDEENENSDAAGAWNAQSRTTTAASSVTPSWTWTTNAQYTAVGQTWDESSGTGSFSFGFFGR